MNSIALINEFLGQPPNASEHGFQIDHIIEFSHWFMAALFFGWSAFFVFVLIRFHKSRHPKADHSGVRSGISTHLEFSCVLIEAVLLIGFAIPLWAERVNEFPTTQDAILVHVVGQQFNWTFHLPGPDGQFGRRDINLVTNSNPLGLDPNDPSGKDDLVVLGELHVPVNRPVIIELSSKDVIHNFDLPHMRIAADGTWFYQKTPIGRPALVKLFASVLKREANKYYLVTPVEKCGIAVDDAPFLAVELRIEHDPVGPRLAFRTNVDDWVDCGPDHPLRFEAEAGTGGLKPYLHVRRELWAKLTRALFYDLVALGEERELAGERWFGVASAGAFFKMAAADSLKDLR